MRLPKRIAQQHYRRGAGFLFRRIKIAAKDRTHAHHGQKIRRDNIGGYVFRLAHTRTRKIETRFLDIRHLRKRPVLCSPVQKIWIGSADVTNPWRRFIQDNELRRILVRQRLQENTINCRKYRAVSTDAQGEGKDGDNGEAGRLAQHAKGEANVLCQRLEPYDTPNLARLLLHPRDVAKFAQGRITRFLGRHPALDVVLCLLLDVVPNVLVEIVQYPLAPPHDSPSCSTGRRIRAIAPASLSHLLVSTSSCR